MEYMLRIASVLVLVSLPLIGLGLAVVSGVLEYQVALVMTNSRVGAAIAVSMLESLKIVTIVLYSLGHTSTQRLTRTLTNGLRISLLLLSMTATTLFIGQLMDRPNLDALRAEARREIDVRFDYLLQQERDAFAKRKAHLDSRLVEEEFRRYPDGRYRGPRYSEYSQELDTLRTRHIRRLAEISTRREMENADAMSQEYANDDRASNRAIASWLFLLKDAMGWQVRPSQLAMTIGALFGFTLELAIYLSFLYFGAMHHRPLKLLIQQKALRGSVRASENNVDAAHRPRPAHKPDRAAHSGRKPPFYTHTRIVP